MSSNSRAGAAYITNAKGEFYNDDTDQFTHIRGLALYLSYPNAVRFARKLLEQGKQAPLFIIENVGEHDQKVYQVNQEGDVTIWNDPFPAN